MAPARTAASGAPAQPHRRAGGARVALLVPLAWLVLVALLAPRARAEEPSAFSPSPEDPLRQAAEGAAVPWASPASQGAARRDGRDSYLAAYAASHGAHLGGDEGDGGDAHYPDALYGAPPTSYGAPSHAYGAPGPYPAPAPAPAYGPPFGHHRDHGPLPVLEIATVLKIILKVLIFKMIVKFIAVICLLLFLPKFKAAKASAAGSGDDEERRALHSLTDAGAAAALWRDLAAAARRYEGAARRR